MATKTKAKAPAELSPLEMHALAIAAKASGKVRDRLDVGPGQLVDFKVCVRGAVDVAGETSAVQSESVSATTLLGLALQAMGPRTRPAAIAAVIDECAAFVEGADAPKLTDEAKKFAEDIMRKCSRPKTIKKRGNVTGSVAVQLIND